MEVLDIQINNAKIEHFIVYLEEDIPRVAVSIGLYAGTRNITSFTIDSGSYNKDNKFTVSPSMIPAIKDIAAQLEVIAVRHCRMALKELGNAVNSDA